MLKKFLALLLAMAMMASLAACVQIDPDDGSTNSGGNRIPDGTEPSQSASDYVFEEVVLVDNEVCTFKVTAVDEDNFWGFTMKAYVENKTDKDLMFSMSDVSVNGFMCDPVWANIVTAGMKSNEEIIFMSTSLEANNIDTVTEIEFTLNVHDSNDIMSGYLVEEVYTVYPLGEDAVQPFVRQSVEGEVVLFDNEYCTMIVTGYDPENMWGYAMNVYVENKTDKTLMFSTLNASVNGFMCDPLWAEQVAPGKRSNTQITWFEDAFEENNITQVETISLPIQVSDSDDWLADPFVDETFTVNP